MSRTQELVAAALRVCELEGEGAPAPAIMAAIARLRTAVRAFQRRGDATLAVFSGVGLRTGEGFVELGGMELPATLPAPAAAEVGRNLIAAAATAETEAALLAELRAMGLEDGQIGGLLGAMRRRREASP